MVVSRKRKLVSSLLLLLCYLFVFAQTATAIEILYEESFQANRITDDWVFYGDPISNLSLEQGNPAPSFNNNGDSMGASGIKSRFSFLIEDGICMQADVFITCHPRGTWVGIHAGMYDFDSEINQTQQDLMPAHFSYFSIDYSGELAWHCPHIETSIGLHCLIPERKVTRVSHLNQYLGEWFTFTVEILPDERNLFINDSLFYSHEIQVIDPFTAIGFFMGGQATNWGTVLVDNLIVYRP